MKKAYLWLGVGLLGCGSSSTGSGLATAGGGAAGAGAAGAGGGNAGASAAGNAGASAAGGSVGAGNGGASNGGATGIGAGGASCAGTVTTDGVQCSYAYSGLNSSASVATDSTVSWSCAGGLRSVTANGIPDHEVGTFPNPNCPNTIAASKVAASVTLDPASTGKATKVGIVGYALNGVKLDPSTAGSCSVSGGMTTCSLIGAPGTWNIEALGQSSFNFGVDANNAHVQPTGEYHYHGMPEGVLTKLSGGAMAPTLVGFSLDGFPVYARYGYSNPTDATSAVKAMTGSWQLKATPDSGRPSTTTYPMGAFTQDYEYAAGSGDLDECNGRTGVTPEFPCGIYHYYIIDTYPFIQRCVKGTPMGGSMGMGPGGVGAGGGSGGTGAGGGPGAGGGGNPAACMPGQTSMCCGDGKCDGPETHANCPADCP